MPSLRPAPHLPNPALASCLTVAIPALLLPLPTSPSPLQMTNIYKSKEFFFGQGMCVWGAMNGLPLAPPTPVLCWQPALCVQLCLPHKTVHWSINDHKLQNPEGGCSRRDDLRAGLEVPDGKGPRTPHPHIMATLPTASMNAEKSVPREREGWVGETESITSSQADRGTHHWASRKKIDQIIFGVQNQIEGMEGGVGATSRWDQLSVMWSWCRKLASWTDCSHWPRSSAEAT